MCWVIPPGRLSAVGCFGSFRFRRQFFDRPCAMPPAVLLQPGPSPGIQGLSPAACWHYPAHNVHPRCGPADPPSPTTQQARSTCPERRALPTPHVPRGRWFAPLPRTAGNRGPRFGVLPDVLIPIIQRALIGADLDPTPER